MNSSIPEYIAFSGSHCLIKSSPANVALKVKQSLEENPEQTILIFDTHSSDQIELNLHGTIADVSSRYPQLSDERTAQSETVRVAEERRSPGRPKLGVTPKEVTLFPRHWDWLSQQPGGASVTLRKLVEKEMRTTGDRERKRQLSDAAYKFMHAMAGNEAGFEEASRALYASNRETFHILTKKWPSDVLSHLNSLTDPLFDLTTKE